MSVDKFGRHNTFSKMKPIPCPPGKGFYLTNDGDYNMLNKRLCNVAEPKLSSDVNVQYMKDNVFVLNNDEFDANYHFIRRLKFPEQQSDAASKTYIDKKTAFIEKRRL